MTRSISKASRLSAWGLGVSALALAASPAWAQRQETDATDAEDVAPANNVIVVTAQFREQDLQDTPLAITAVTGAEMEAKSQTDLATVGDSAPNVQIRPQAANFGPSVSASIRGIGQTDYNPAYEPGVGIYIDDVYYPSLTGAVFDTLDLERVEILRGPQGTLAGRNSIGGAIKLYSRTPNGDSSGFLEGAYGSRERVSLRGAADFALTDTVFVRISGVSKRQDGYVDQLDFGCVYPAGGGATFVNQNGETVPINPEGGEEARVFTDDCLVGKLGGINYQAVRGIVRFEPNSDFDFTVIADFTDDDRTMAAEVLDSTDPNTNPNVATPGGLPFDDRFICGPFCNFAVDGNAYGGPFVRRIPTDPFNAEGTIMQEVTGENRSRYRGWGISGQANYDLNDYLRLTSITGYREFDTQFFADSDISPARTGYGINNLSNWSFSQEVRLNIEATDTVFVTLGGYYFEQFSQNDSIQDLRYVAPYPLQFNQPDRIAADAMAAFANVSWEVVEGLNVNAGLRYTEESKDQSYFRYNLDGTINAFLDPVGAFYGSGFEGPDVDDYDNDDNTSEVVRALTGQTATYKGDKIDYRIAVDYRFSDSVLGYASVATGFKGGGSNPRPFNAFQLLSFEPETLTAYELGLKTDLFSRDVRFNVSAFLNKFSDIQSTVSPCPTEDPIYSTPSACRVNSGNADIKGIEAELTANPIRGLAINASMSYLDFQFTEVDPRSTAEIDDPGTGAPKWKASAGVQYAIELGNAGSLTPRFDVFYQDRTFAGSEGAGENRNLVFLPSFTTANARLTWQNEDEDIQISLEVTNLFDEYYLLSSFDQRNNTGAKKVSPARPREWAISVRKSF